MMGSPPEPPADGSLADTPALRDLIREVRSGVERIACSGAFVFDIDETLMAPDASLRSEPEVLELLRRLLERGFMLGLISGGPGTVLFHRVFEPLKEAVSAAPQVLSRFRIYANGGSSKYAADAAGYFTEDAAYAAAHRIPGSLLYRIKASIEAYALEGFGLGGREEEVVKAWMAKRQEQWKTVDISFEDGWLRRVPWRADLWDDETMARVKAGREKGRTSFPFINVRRISLAADGRIEGLAGISISGFYALKQEKGDPFDLDWRDRVMERLVRDLGPDVDSLVMKKAGRASIDITGEGTDKAAALVDFIADWKCDPSSIYYFGDEFVPGGNDLPVAESQALGGQGVRLIALNRREPPPLPRILWAGRSCAATLELLRKILD